MDVFEKLKNGEPVDMMSEEYRPAIAELHRADKALFHVNHAEPGSEGRIRFRSRSNHRYGSNKWD